MTVKARTKKNKCKEEVSFEEIRMEKYKEEEMIRLETAQTMEFGEKLGLKFHGANEETSFKGMERGGSSQ